MDRHQPSESLADARRDCENGALAGCLARKCNKLHNEHSSCAPVKCCKTFMLQVSHETSKIREAIDNLGTDCSDFAVLEKSLFGKFARTFFTRPNLLTLETL